MAPILYQIPASPPVRAVLMTAKSIGLNLDLKEVNLLEDEHKTPEYLKLNPQHTVPTLVDIDGFVIWDSHAIMSYIISKYGKDDSLYPTDIKRRALIDQRLHFDSGVVFSQLLRILRPIIYHGKNTVDQADKDAVEEIYQFVETFLNGRQWIAGDTVTIADYSLISSITSHNILVPVDSKKYPKLSAWIKKAEALPEYDQNKVGLDILTTMLKSLVV